MNELREADLEVEKEFNKAIEYDKTDDYSMIAISDLIATRDPDEALKWLERSRHVTLNYSQLAYIYQRIAKIQSQKKLFPAALESIERAIAIKPGERYFYLNRADIERDTGKTSETAVGRHLSEGYVQAGDTLLRLGRKAEALSLYWSSIEGLAPLLKSKNERKLDSDVADTVSKISNVIESTSSRTKAAEFWETAMESGRWNEVRDLFEKEKERLSAAR